MDKETRAKLEKLIEQIRNWHRQDADAYTERWSVGDKEGAGYMRGRAEAEVNVLKKLTKLLD